MGISNYSKLIDPPASEELIEKYFNLVLKRALKNLNVTIISFRGSGDISNLMYLIRNPKILGEDTSDRIFVLVDLEKYDDDIAEGLRESLSFINNHYKSILDTESQDKLNSVLAHETISQDLLNEFLYYITYDKGFKLTFIIDNFRLACGNSVNSGALVSSLDSMKKVAPMNFSFIFICDCEVTEDTKDHLGGLSQIFIENIVNGKELLFGKDSAEVLFKYHSGLRKLKYDRKYISRCSELSYGDPSTLKQLAAAVTDNEEIQEKIIKAKSVKETYDIVGKEWLDHRFKKIINSLSKDSLEYLGTLGDKKDNYPSDYLLFTGLVCLDESGGEPKLLNPLFEQYVLDNKNTLISVGGLIKYSFADVPQKIRKTLSAKELQVYSLLVNRGGELVARDEVAQCMWGNEWEDRYSDWAIDRLLSDMRGKLKNVDAEKEMKTVKGKGIMLV
ncbi:helix-turn-helix domain-containing protein [Patescibacteria group bacterium]|nr:helix-turn-helix domain-containing protein [Patescibacteria group bacterium]